MPPTGQRPLVHPGLQLEYLPPGTILGRKKANLMIGILRGLVRLQIIRGPADDFQLTENNALLTLATEVSATSDAGTGIYQGDWSLAATYAATDIVTTVDNSGFLLTHLSLWAWLGPASGNSPAKPSWHNLAGGSSTDQNWLLMASTVAHDQELSANVTIAGTTLHFLEGRLVQVT